MQTNSPSFLAGVWRRLRKNKGAVAGLTVIGIALFVAIFGYFIAPDPTPFANRMTVEIGGRTPGFKQLFLLIKKDAAATASPLQQALHGKPDAFVYMPISSFTKIGDSIQAERFIDDGVTETVRYAKSSLAPQIATRKTFVLGTDKFGRDIASRLIIGTRVSLGVGLVTVVISLLVGVSLGALGGYFGGRTDAVVQWIINVIWSIPTLLLVFAITLLLGKGFWQIFVAIGLTMWVNVARLVRGQVLATRELQYVEAARVLGFSHARIIVRHILPNISGPILVIAASNFASAIVIEAGLSFLGIGVQPPQPSWGLMIRENYNFIITQNPALALAPGVAIMLLVLSFNLLGNGLRDAIEVKS